jgi:hypothetical protein
LAGVFSINFEGHCLKGEELRALRIAAFLLPLSFAPAARAIVGGTQIAAGEAAKKSIVNIKMYNGMCTGTLVAPHTVLAAAHCRDLFGNVEIAAYIGAGTTAPCDIAEVEEVAFAPDAVRELPLRVHAPDILLIRLKTPMCSPAPASLDFTPLNPGEILFGAGHGQGNKEFGAAERFALQVIASDEARAQVSPVDENAELLLTAGAKTYLYGVPVVTGSSFCHGDSGGPVYNESSGEMRVRGVNGAILPNEAKGSAQCDYSYLQILTPIAPYKDWIQSKIAEWN